MSHFPKNSKAIYNSVLVSGNQTNRYFFPYLKKKFFTHSIPICKKRHATGHMEGVHAYHVRVSEPAYIRLVVCATVVDGTHIIVNSRAL